MERRKDAYHRPLMTYTIIYILFVIVVCLILGRQGVFDEPMSVSDYIGAAMAVASFFIGCVAIYLTNRSLRFTQQAEEGQLYIKMMERYSSPEMVSALKTLGSFRNLHEHDLDNAFRRWHESLKKGEEEAVKIELARHKVKYFYRDLMQLYQAGYISEPLTKRLLNTGGRYLFRHMVLPMERYANKLQFDQEFYPFERFHDQITAEQKIVVPDNFKAVCLIPARLESTRYPQKLIQKLGSKAVILRTYENVVSMGLFDKVYVVTDSEIIYNEIISNGGQALLNKRHHESGSDRIAEAAESLDADIIVNVQGDEPMTKKELIAEMLEEFKGEGGRNVQVVTPMQLLTDPSHINSPNYVKVVTDKNRNALYFSRSVIPHDFSASPDAEFYEHIGVYAFRREALLRFSRLPMTPLEALEKVECLRYLENGIPIRMVRTEYMGIEIDTPEDLERAQAYFTD